MRRYTRFMLAALLTMTAILVFSPSSHVIAGGWVKNQSFENGAGEVPYSWNMSGNATRIDSGPTYAGNWTARITKEGDTLTQWIGNVTGFAVYEGWGWIYVASNVTGNFTGVIAFDFWKYQEGTQLGPTIMLAATNTNGAYVQRTTTLQAPAETTHLRVRLLGTNWNDEAEARFDEIGFYVSGWGCFIATAAYGTHTASQIDILRDFRDKVLLKNDLGSRLVETYYRVSPPLADFIAKNDFLRAIIRELLVDQVVNFLQWSQDLWRT